VRRGWPVELHSLPSLLHNHPERIVPAAERLARSLQARGLRVALGYADCGSYGALDDLCARLNLRRLPGLHCYDVLAGPARLREMFEREPGTYLLTDFLVRSFRRSVLADVALYHAMLNEEAAAFEYLKRASAADPNDQEVLYKSAKVYNQFGDTTQALNYLEKSIIAGYSRVWPRDDPAFANLYKNSRFRRIVS